jgi:peptidoglycan DL-endopeptidase CwlO
MGTIFLFLSCRLNKFILFVFLFITLSTNTNLTANNEPKPIGVVMSQVRFDILDLAKSLLGIHYKSGGVDQSGFDCSGFTSYVLKHFDIDAVHSSGAQANQGNVVALQNTRPGDLVFFGSNRYISHVGIIFSNDEEGVKMIHASSSRGIVIESITDQNYWLSKLRFAIDVVGD